MVTVVHGRHEHFAHHVRSVARFAPGLPHVVVAMDDPEIAGLSDRVGDASSRRVVELSRQDGRLPLAAARNQGARHALALGATHLWFLDVDCTLSPVTPFAYQEASRLVPEAVWSGSATYLRPGQPPPTDGEQCRARRSPHPAQPTVPPGSVVRDVDHDLLWSLNVAMSAPVWETLGGFCEAYAGYGGEDTDFAWKAAALGVELVWVGGAEVFHQWHPVSDPPVEHLDDILRNAATAHARWGRWPMRGWLDRFVELGLVHHDGSRYVRSSARDLRPSDGGPD